MNHKGRFTFSLSLSLSFFSFGDALEIRQSFVFSIDDETTSDRILPIICQPVLKTLAVVFSTVVLQRLRSKLFPRPTSDDVRATFLRLLHFGSAAGAQPNAVETCGILATGVF